jgi:hypothetical protein
MPPSTGTVAPVRNVLSIVTISDGAHVRITGHQEAARRVGRGVVARDADVMTASSSRPGPDERGEPRRLLFSLRYVVPAAVCAAGLLILLLAGAGGYGPDALAGLFGAGGAIYLMNKFMRMGIEGDDDRDVEEARRLFLDRYGMWPDEIPAGWVPPDGQPDAATAFNVILERRRASDVAA